MKATDLARLAGAVKGLHLLAFFGSRARGDEQPDSDWDLGQEFSSVPALQRREVPASGSV